MEQKNYDTIVIGAGLGGLGAALEASNRGLKVLLLEQHNIAGGFATSFVRGRFEFEPSLHETQNKVGPDDESNAIRYIEKNNLDVTFIEIPEAYRLILTDKNVDLNVPYGIEKFIDFVANEVPGSLEAVTNYINLCCEIHASLDFLGENPDAPKSVLFKEHENFLRTGSATAQEVADALNVPQAAQDIIHAYWCYLGTPTNKLSFTVWATMLVCYLSKPPVFPKNRSHEIATALVERIKENGGDLFLNAQVEKIIVEKNAVKGVELSDGKVFFSDSIISNASPTNVYRKLISPQSAVPKKAQKNVNARKQGISFVVVYLGLDITYQELGLNEYSYFVSPDMDTEKLYNNSFKLYNEEPLTIAVSLNASNEGCSPDGTSIVSLTIPSRAEAWKDVAAEDYYDTKNRVADQIISYFEKSLNVNLRDHIEEIEISTPLTFARYTGSYNGAVYGYQVEPWDGLVPRALAEKKETYIKGLTFAGGHGNRSHGYGCSLMSGVAAGSSVKNGENK